MGKSSHLGNVRMIVWAYGVEGTTWESGGALSMGARSARGNALAPRTDTKIHRIARSLVIDLPKRGVVLLAS